MTGKEPAWVIGHITVKDTAKWDQYRASVPATLLPWHGELLLRGRCLDVLHGSHSHTDSVVLRFPDIESARGWHRSAAYQALLPLRSSAAGIELFIVG